MKNIIIYRSFLVPNYSSAFFFLLLQQVLSGPFFAAALPLIRLTEGHLEDFFFFFFANGFISPRATILLTNSATQSS